MMSLVEFFSQPVWHRLGLTLVHFLWQGLAAAVIVCTAVRVLGLKRGNPRYVAYLLAFVGMAVSPLLTFTILDRPVAPAIAAPEPALALESSGPPTRAVPTPIPAQFGEDALPVAAAYEVPLRQRLYGMLQASLPWALAGWMGGVLILSVRLLLGFLGVHRWRRNLEPLADDLRVRVAWLSERLGLRGFSRVFVSRRALEVVALGYLRPMVLLPATLVTQMSPEMLEAVIAHELAHIRRYDLWINLAQRVVETLLFYHPAVWWLSFRLRSERELCCDELAVQATGQRLTYASALETAGRIRLALRQPVLAVGLGPGRKSTLGRVRHVLGLPPASRESRFWLAGIITVVLLAAVATPTVSLLAAGTEGKAHLGDLIRTFQDPNVNGRSQFGYSLAAVGDNVLVGAPMNRVVYVFEGSTSRLLRTFVAPEPAQARLFGWYVAVVGTNVVIADPAYGFNGEASVRAPGRVYLFHGRTGELLQTLVNPKPDSYIVFGQAVAGMGDNRVVIEATSQDRTSSVVFLFEASTGKMLQVFEKPKRAARVNPMYACVTTAGENVLVNAPEDDTGAEGAGCVYMFDSSTGKLVSTFLNPTPTAGDNFGSVLAASGDNVLIGAGYATISGKRTGAAYLFDRGTGKLLRTLLNPTPGAAGTTGQGDIFGRSVAFVGTNALIGVSLDDTGAENAGAAYLFDSKTGKVLHKFLNPHPVADARFGVQVAALGNDILIAAYDPRGSSRGAVYRFKGVD